MVIVGRVWPRQSDHGRPFNRALAVMSWVRDIPTFRDFISYVLLSAPHDFPEEDFLGHSEQMNLERAWEELKRGVDLLAPKLADLGQLRDLHTILDRSYGAYRSGDANQGARLLQEFESLAFRDRA